MLGNLGLRVLKGILYVEDIWILWVGSVIYFFKYSLIRLVANILELIMSLLDVLGRPVTCTL
jgi:hypothetical protein